MPRRGYWRKPEATAASFEAKLAGTSEGFWLRTGDLGMLDETGELFVAGRSHDLIIIRGTNHHPHDIEDSVQRRHPALRRHGGAVFAMADEWGEERLVVVQEIERGFLGEVAIDDIEDAIREAVADDHELSVAHIVLIRAGTLPKTTSGKIQRRLTKQLWIDGKLDVVA